MKRIFLIYFFIILIFPGAGYAQDKTVCFKKICVKVEIADNQEKRTQGLMFREKLGKNEGMLFVFDKENYLNFWMKNMKIPLDIIWLDRNKKIIDIHKNVLPCRDSCPDLTPSQKAQYVLEVNSGFTDKNNISIGQAVSQ